MIIRGGENVYPREIEEFLYAHPDVADVQVVGVPDERYGEEIAAFVDRARGRRSSTPTRCASSASGKIAHYKVPRYVMLVDEFPMTVTGKVQKFKLREQAIEELGLQAAAGLATAWSYRSAFSNSYSFAASDSAVVLHLRQAERLAGSTLKIVLAAAGCGPRPGRTCSRR